MARKSIFELLAEQFDIEKDIERMDLLFSDEKVITEGSGRSRNYYTIQEFVNIHCFDDWKSRGHCLDIDDFLDCVDYDGNYRLSTSENIDACLTVIEIIYNFWTLASICCAQNEEFATQKGFVHLGNIMDDCLSRYNYKAVYNDESEQLLVIENRPEVTAVAEIVEPDLALEVLRYNHRSMRGNIAQKKYILLILGSELEPKRKLLNSINSSMEDAIFFMLNNMNLRHNNCNTADKNYRDFIANMDDDTLEHWYDELYQMMLLAFLELDQRERNSKIAELKANIIGTAN